MIEPNYCQLMHRLHGFVLCAGWTDASNASLLETSQLLVTPFFFLFCCNFGHCMLLVMVQFWQTRVILHYADKSLTYLCSDLIIPRLNILQVMRLSGGPLL